MPRPTKTRPASLTTMGDIGPAGPVLDLNSHIGTKVAILANRLSRAASRYYRTRYGIGVVEWRLMMCIGQVTETRASRICSETELDKGAVSRSLAVLQRLGLVGIKEDGSDSRTNNVALTPKGRALHDEMVPIALDRQSELVADLTQAEVEIFTALIDRLQAKVLETEPLPDERPSLLPAVPRSRQRPRRPAAARPRRSPRSPGVREVRQD
jgi:DNA-binding MarR family transcriptional regulator